MTHLDEIVTLLIDWRRKQKRHAAIVLELIPGNRQLADMEQVKAECELMKLADRIEEENAASK